jgi:hypothetical protein
MFVNIMGVRTSRQCTDYTDIYQVHRPREPRPATSAAGRQRSN